jgi:ABC-2 type transport system permease protein
MRKISIIAGKELRGYLYSPIAYIIFSVFLVLTGWYFGSYLRQIDYNNTTIQGFLNIAGWCILLFHDAFAVGRKKDGDVGIAADLSGQRYRCSVR